MRLVLSAVVSGRGGTRLLEPMLLEYAARAGRYEPCSAMIFGSERLFRDWLAKQAGRTRPVLILLDRGGSALSSEEFAAQMGRLRDGGAQMVVYAIGPADGWSQEMLARADHVVSFGPITLPHELARVVLAEQVYRALTILAGHPYHSGH